MDPSNRPFFSPPSLVMPHPSLRSTVPLLVLFALPIGACWTSSSDSHDEARAKARPAAESEESTRHVRQGSSGVSGGEETSEKSSETGELRPQVVDALSGYEHFPSRQQLDNLAGPDRMVPTLLDIYDEEDVEAFQRQRVIGALRYYPTDRVRKWYEELLADPETPRIDRRLAIKAYGAGFDAEAVSAIADKLSHPDYHTRKAAVSALADIDDEAARAALEKRLDRESEKLIRERIEKALEAE